MYEYAKAGGGHGAGYPGEAEGEVIVQLIVEMVSGRIIGVAGAINAILIVPTRIGVVHCVE